MKPYKFSPTPSEILQMPRQETAEELKSFARPGPDRSSVYVPPLILKVDGLIKIYGQRRVVDGVSFYVNRGEIVGLLGPNGAGKTTSFRMTCGMIDTNGGMVFLNGKDVTNWPMFRRAREGGMGYLPQDKSVFSGLTVQDNLLAVMELLGIDSRTRRQRCDELLEKFNLTHIRKNLAGSGGQSGGLSGGERRRLEIARALVSDPKIILLDEPFANIDPITVASIQQIIKQLSEENISILITDHQVRETLQITHRSYVIQQGSVLCHGTPAEVLANEEARRVYFGNDVGIAQPTTIHSINSYTAPVRPPQVPKPQKPASTSTVEKAPEVPIRPRPEFPHTSNSGRPIK
ncbi:MAG: LPS export ABC transporter ATP-binding protein [Planctomycetaceae bacterium]|nr:LPS export ABC transporter ATP-binding protein [Planctomycetaceae bacterium]